MNEYIYDMTVAVIEYGVSTNPCTQMGFLGFDVVNYAADKRGQYKFYTSNNVGGLPEYVQEVYRCARVKRAAA